MITIMAAQIFIQAALLCGILYLVAKHEADYSFAKVAMVTAATVAGAALIEVLLTEHIGWLTIFPVLGFVAFMLMTFCWISLGKSIVVVVLFMGVHVAISTGVQAVENHLAKKLETTGPVSDEDFKMAQEFLAQSFGMDPSETAVADVPTDERGTEGSAPAREQADPAATPLTAEKPVATSAPEPVEEDEWAEARARLKIGGIMHAGQRGRVALVNNQPVSEGDTVTTALKGKVYRWRIAAIAHNDLDLRPIDCTASSQ